MKRICHTLGFPLCVRERQAHNSFSVLGCISRASPTPFFKLCPPGSTWMPQGGGIRKPNLGTLTRALSCWWPLPGPNLIWSPYSQNVTVTTRHHPRSPSCLGLAAGVSAWVLQTALMIYVPWPSVQHPSLQPPTCRKSLGIKNTSENKQLWCIISELFPSSWRQSPEVTYSVLSLLA